LTANAAAHYASLGGARRSLRRRRQERVVQLLREQHVAVAPGTTFGAQGEGWIRISLATETDDLLEGLERLAAVGARR
jgi:aspartate/methionine/tyrosine aminotransferase